MVELCYIKGVQKKPFADVLRGVYTMKFFFHGLEIFTSKEKCRNFLNHYENIEKALTIMLLATGVKFDGENEQVKKRTKRSVWMKPWLKPSTYKCIPKYISGTRLKR